MMEWVVRLVLLELGLTVGVSLTGGARVTEPAVLEEAGGTGDGWVELGEGLLASLPIDSVKFEAEVPVLLPGVAEFAGLDRHEVEGLERVLGEVDAAFVAVRASGLREVGDGEGVPVVFELPPAGDEAMRAVEEFERRASEMIGRQRYEKLRLVLRSELQRRYLRRMSGGERFRFFESGACEHSVAGEKVLARSGGAGESAWWVKKVMGGEWLE